MALTSVWPRSNGRAARKTNPFLDHHVVGADQRTAAFQDVEEEKRGRATGGARRAVGAKTDIICNSKGYPKNL